jgi:hypothetical protein
MMEKPEITELRERLHRTLDNIHTCVSQLPEGEPKGKLEGELANLSSVLKEWSRVNRQSLPG